MDIFWTFGSGSLSVTTMLNFSGEANTSIHGLGEDDTAKGNVRVRLGCFSLIMDFNDSVCLCEFIPSHFCYIRKKRM